MHSLVDAVDTNNVPFFKLIISELRPDLDFLKTFVDQGSGALALNLIRLFPRYCNNSLYSNTRQMTRRSLVWYFQLLLILKFAIFDRFNSTIFTPLAFRVSFELRMRLVRCHRGNMRKSKGSTDFPLRCGVCRHTRSGWRSLLVMAPGSAGIFSASDRDLWPSFC